MIYKISIHETSPYDNTAIIAGFKIFGSKIKFDPRYFSL